MAISLTTDWSKMRYIMLFIFATNVLLASTVATGLTTSGKQKRQLFREHLLPQQGGKIPKSAFRPDRLLLNRLNQQGIYSNDGIYFEQRRPEVHYHPKLWGRETLKLTVRPDPRYVAPVGRYYLPAPHTVDTTYVIREPTRTSFPFLSIPQPPAVLPYTSINLLRHHLHRNNGIVHESRWNDVFPSRTFHEQILEEFIPYLHKLHVFDYD